MTEFDFVFEALDGLMIETKPMFGTRAIYVDGKIVFALRHRESSPEDNGVWIATSGEHHASLLEDFPSMRSIKVFGVTGPTGWQVLPLDSDDFEDSVLKACRFVRFGDPRIGKIPKRTLRRKKKSPRKTATKASAKKSVRKKKR